MKLKVVIMVLSIVACFFATSAYAAQMSVEPVNQEVFQEENVTVNIMVYPEGSEVYTASYTLYFDNTLLKAISQTQGSFLNQDDEGTNVIENKIDNAIARIEYGEMRIGTDVGVNDSGVLTTITFQAIGVDGVSPLDISDYNGELLYSTSGPITTDINNGTCKIEDMVSQTSTSTPAIPPTTTATITPVQTPTSIPITPTPTAAEIQTSTILSTPSQSPTMITSPTSPRDSTSPLEEKSEENNGLSGFRAAFAITGLLAVFILKRKNVRK